MCRTVPGQPGLYPRGSSPPGAAASRRGRRRGPGVGGRCGGPGHADRGPPRSAPARSRVGRARRTAAARTAEPGLILGAPPRRQRARDGDARARSSPAPGPHSGRDRRTSRRQTASHRPSRLPIFEAVESDWFRRGAAVRGRLRPDGAAENGNGWASPADDGWRAAEVVHAPDLGRHDPAGLPKRGPRPLVPQPASRAQAWPLGPAAMAAGRRRRRGTGSPVPARREAGSRCPVPAADLAGGSRTRGGDPQGRGRDSEHRVPGGESGAVVSPLVRPAQDLNWLITNFVERVASVAHAIVVSSDGLPMAYSQGFPADRVDQLAAVTSGLTSLTQGASRVFEGACGYSDGGGDAAGVADCDGDQ